MDITVPRILKDLIDRINATRGLGLVGLLAYWELFSRAGELVGKDGFVGSLTKLVEEHEALPTTATQAKPSAHDVKREKLRRLWEKRLSAFLGFAVTVPLPPALNRKQTRALARYGFLILFIPSIGEEQYPAHMVKPNWGEYLEDVDSIEHIPLVGRWVAVETIAKPKYNTDYPNDWLASAIGGTSRFGRRYAGSGFGGCSVEDILAKFAPTLGFDPSSVQLPSVEEWNFVANLFIWLREQEHHGFPDLGVTDSWEWCRNRYGRSGRLIVGMREQGGIAAVRENTEGHNSYVAGFRFLVGLS